MEFRSENRVSAGWIGRWGEVKIYGEYNRGWIRRHHPHIANLIIVLRSSSGGYASERDASRVMIFLEI